MDSSLRDQPEANSNNTKKTFYDADEYLKFQVHRAVQTLFVGIIAELEEIESIGDEEFDELRHFIFDRGNGTIRFLKKKVDNAFRQKEE